MPKSFKSVFISLLILLPVLVYLIYAYTNTSSLFFADDFHLLKTIVWVQDAASFSDKFRLFTQQHNEHRIVLPRLLTFLDYLIEGHINWRTLVMFGNLLWCGVIIFFFQAFKSFKVPLWCFIPVPWILLQPQYFDNVTWSISILQQSVVLFWYGLFCLFCAQKKYRLALIVCIVATFTHGNGIFSFPLGILFLLIDRRWKDVLLWVIVLAIVAVLYFWGFQRGQNADFQRSLADPVRLVAAFLAFFGSMTKVQLTNVSYAVLLGGVFAAVLGIYLVPRFFQSVLGKKELSVFDRQLLGNVLFLAITGMLVSVSRSWAGIEATIAPRYQHYAPFVACWVYLVVLCVVKGDFRKYVAGAAIAGGILYNGLCYFVFHEEIIYRKDSLRADTDNWNRHHNFLNYAGTFNSNIEEPYTQAVARGICAPESPGFPSPAANAPTDPRVRFDISSETLIEQDAFGEYKRQFLNISNPEIQGSSYLLLQNKASGQSYWLATKRSNAGVRALASTGRIWQPGFNSAFLAQNVASGNYHIGVLNEGTFFWTNETVAIGVQE